jgi:hypothetical protein
MAQRTPKTRTADLRANRLSFLIRNSFYKKLFSSIGMVKIEPREKKQILA